MSPSPLPGLNGLPAPEALRVEQLCTRFETCWKDAKHRPRLEDFLPAADWLSAGILLCELLQLELAYRHQCGEDPKITEYLPRFPGQETLVEKVFAFLGLGREREPPNDHRFQLAPP